MIVPWSGKNSHVLRLLGTESAGGVYGTRETPNTLLPYLPEGLVVHVPLHLRIHFSSSDNSSGELPGILQQLDLQVHVVVGAK